MKSPPAPPTPVLYLGTDTDFMGQLEVFCKTLKPAPAIIQGHYQEGFILDLAAKAPLGPVFCDLTEDKISLFQLLEEVVYIKSYPPFKSILFVALLADDEDASTSDLLLSVGFQYLYIKGCEEKIALQDCFHIQNGEDPPAHGFAMAKDIFKPILAGLNSSLSAMGPDDFMLETDLPASDGQLQFKLPMFPDLTANSFQIKEGQIGCSRFPMYYSYLMQYPFAGPWDDFSEALLQKETLETWFTLNDDQLSAEKAIVHVVSKDFSLIQQLPQISKALPLHIAVSDELTTDEAVAGVAHSRPALIFIELGNDPDGADGLPAVINLAHHLRTVGIEPFCFLANCALPTHDVQQATTLQQLLATTEKLSLALIQSICTKWHNKGAASPSGPRRCLAITDPRRALDVIHPLNLVELSEHEVTFLTPLEIPMFSVLHFTLPLNFYVTIIPPYRPLRPREGHTHYIGIIHGISETQLRHLRQFVNQVIYSPLKDYSEETLLNVMDAITQDKIPAPPVEPSRPAEVILSAAPTSVPVTPAPLTRKRQIKGKSKL